MNINLSPKPSLAIFIALCSLLRPLPSLAQVCNQNALITTPTHRFIDNSDGVIIDTKNHLMWQKCVDGRTGVNCETGVTQTYSWQAALQRAESLNNTTGFAGFVDWRLPNAKELLSIIERSCMDPALNLQVFPTSSNAFGLWSSTPYIDPINNNDKALEAGFSGLGGLTDTFKIHPRAIRLVRTLTPNPAINAN